MPVSYLPSSRAAFTIRPLVVRVAAMKLKITWTLTNGLPRQFWVMKLNRRCSTLFHLLVPGGKWLTVSFRPISSARYCKATFHRSVGGAVAVAPPAVSRDEQLGGAGKSLCPHLLPPAADAGGREVGGVMINADADPPLVIGHIIDAIRDRLAQFLVLKVVDAHVLQLAFGTPFATAVLEISHQFLLLRVDRDHRLPTLLQPRRLRVDELELGIAIGMLIAFARLAIGLQAVAGLTE